MSQTTPATTPSATLRVDTAKYLAIPKAERIKDRLSIVLADRAYEPRIEDLESDWLAHVAAPAFKLFRQQHGGEAVEAFCSIGTGSGLDVLSAIEILGPSRVGLTDLFEDVVSIAAANIGRNHRQEHRLIVEAGHGDLLRPLERFGNRYGVIYENLPNVPLSDPDELAVERTSSSYVPPRAESLPELVRQQMLDLHYLALLQAKDFLIPGGAILSCLGARVPLAVFLELGRLAGYRSSILTYTWKVQGDANEVIRDHAESQRKGFGPFHFYRSKTLREAFAAVRTEESGPRALEIEAALASEQLDAVSAYEAFRRGESIGHTVAILQSVL